MERKGDSKEARKEYVVRGRAESRDRKTGLGRSRRVALKVSWALGLGPWLRRRGQTQPGCLPHRSTRPGRAQSIPGHRGLGMLRSCIFEAGIER